MFDAICREHGIEHLLTQPEVRPRRARSSGFTAACVRFHAGAPAAPPSNSPAAAHDRSTEDWVSRRVCAMGIVCVCWQQVCIGRHYGGQRGDVHVDCDLLRFWIGDNLVKAAAHTSTDRYETNAPFGPRPGTKSRYRVSRINRHRKVSNQPTLNRRAHKQDGGHRRAWLECTLRSRRGDRRRRRHETIADEAREVVVEHAIVDRRALDRRARQASQCVLAIELRQ